jgi:hypothetical protein
MFSLLASVIFALHSPGGAAADSVDLATITKAYSTIVGVAAIAPPGDDSVLVLKVDSPPPGSLLSGFFRDHALWFGYLVTNGRSFDVPGLNSAKGGNVAAARLQQDLLRRLVVDSEFNALVVPAIAAYLNASGVPVRRALLKPSTTRSIPIDTAMRVATRFFYPDILTPNGILTHVCTRINAVRELGNHDLALEALAFSAIMRDIMREDSSRIEVDFGPARHQMNRLDAPGASEEVRLSRAQGMMWAMMSQSRALRDLLLAEANRDRVILPFELRS